MTQPRLNARQRRRELSPSKRRLTNRILRRLDLHDRHPSCGYTVEQLCRVRKLRDDQPWTVGQIFSRRGYHQAKYVLVRCRPQELGVERPYYPNLDLRWDKYELALIHLGEFYADNRYKISDRPRNVRHVTFWSLHGTQPSGPVGGKSWGLMPSDPVGHLRPPRIADECAYTTGREKNHDMRFLAYGPPRPPRIYYIPPSAEPLVNESGCLYGYISQGGFKNLIRGLPVPKWDVYKSPASLVPAVTPASKGGPEAVLAQFKLKSPSCAVVGSPEDAQKILAKGSGVGVDFSASDDDDELFIPDDEPTADDLERADLVGRMASYLGCTFETARAILGAAEQGLAGKD